MAMSAGASFGRARRPEPTSEINVTPLVDVMLVLLVIFMITAPTLQKDSLDVKLPQSKAGTGAGKPAYQLSVLVDETGRVHFGGKSFEADEAEIELPKMLKGYEQKAVVLKAFRGLPYERVVRVMSILRLAGIKDIVIAVETAATGKPGR